MPANIITTDDLREFKMELLDDIKNLLSKQANRKIKKYLKSSVSFPKIRPFKNRIRQATQERVQ